MIHCCSQFMYDIGLQTLYQFYTHTIVLAMLRSRTFIKSSIFICFCNSNIHPSLSSVDFRSLPSQSSFDKFCSFQTNIEYGICLFLSIHWLQKKNKVNRVMKTYVIIRQYRTWKVDMTREYRQSVFSVCCSLHGARNLFNDEKGVFIIQKNYYGPARSIVYF